ncbi:MAG: cytochrome c [Phycisphaerales bacterium]|nr:cytochrome c [Phycisphaerales bacterium]
MAEESTPQDHSSWSSRCEAGGKIVILAFLVACFAIQTALVYSDASPSAPLSPQAQEGRLLWHAHNCQACHQLYGFGGFLGPDLTNVSARVGPDRIEQILLEGSAQMPAFEFDHDHIAAVTAFLSAMNDSGHGQALAPQDESGMHSVIVKVLRRCDDPKVEVGYQRFAARGCLGCHFSSTQQAIDAADLLDTCGRLSREDIMQVLTEGRPPKMPPQRMTQLEREEIHVFLLWLHEHRTTLRDTFDAIPIRWSETPWWEFGP